MNFTHFLSAAQTASGNNWQNVKGKNRKADASFLFCYLLACVGVWPGVSNEVTTAAKDINIWVIALKKNKKIEWIFPGNILKCNNTKMLHVEEILCAAPLNQ